MSAILLSGCAIIKDDKIVLVKKKGKDFWELPGGVVNSGEPEEVAVEKTCSQIGIKPEVIQQFTMLEFQIDGKNIESSIFECSIDQTLSFAPGENIDKIKWWDISKISKENLGQDVQAILEEL